MVTKSRAVNPIATHASTKLINVQLAKTIRSLQLLNIVSHAILVSTKIINKLAAARTVSISIRTVLPATYVMIQTVLGATTQEKTVKCATKTSYLEPRRSASGALWTLAITTKTLNAARA